MQPDPRSVGHDRRRFLKHASVAALAPLALGRAWERQPRTASQDGIVINMLGGVSNPNLRLAARERGAIQPPTRGLDARALRDARASGVTATNTTVGYVAGLMEPFEESVRTVAEMNSVIRAHPDDLLKVWSAADIRRAKAEEKVGIILGFQNAAMMGRDASRVDLFAGLGVKIIQLTYNGPNQLGDGSMAREGRGLTPFGHEVVERLNATRTLVDLSHSGEQICLDAIRASSVPVCISHTGCRALADNPRNKTDAELRLLAERGGMVGIYFMPFLKEDSFPDPIDVVRHIEHAIDVCGEDQVGIGTDGGFTQIDDLEAYQAVINREVAARQSAGISATGEKAGVTPFIPEMQGPDQFRQLADMMSSRGHSAARIDKVLGGNFLRLLEDTWGG